MCSIIEFGNFMLQKFYNKMFTKQFGLKVKCIGFQFVYQILFHMLLRYLHLYIRYVNVKLFITKHKIVLVTN